LTLHEDNKQSTQLVAMLYLIDIRTVDQSIQ